MSFLDTSTSQVKSNQFIYIVPIHDKSYLMITCRVGLSYSSIYRDPTWPHEQAQHYWTQRNVKFRICYKFKKVQFLSVVAIQRLISQSVVGNLKQIPNDIKPSCYCGWEERDGGTKREKIDRRMKYFWPHYLKARWPMTQDFPMDTIQRWGNRPVSGN